MTVPLISVIVPVYKVETYLEDCVQSILRQTYQHLEIILVDDGSPDGCPEMCDAYARQDSRVRVIHQENRGLSAARNAGMEAMTGEYFGFVDSDDYIEPTMYEKLLEPMSEMVRLTQCAFFHHSPDKPGIVQRCYKQETHSAEEFFRLYHYHKYRTPVWLRLYSTDHFGHMRFKEGRYAEDHLFTYQLGIEMLRQGLQMVHVPYCLIHYRVLESGITISHKTPLYVEETRNLKDLLREEERDLKRFGFFDIVDNRLFTHLFVLKARSINDTFYRGFFEKEFAGDLVARKYHREYQWGIRHIIYYYIVQYLPWLFRWPVVKDFCTKCGEEPVSKRDVFY